MTTREQNIKKIRDACIAAQSAPNEIVKWERPIRLADVLLAIEQIGHHAISVMSFGGRGRFVGMATTSKPPSSWNLRHDDLTAQSDETLEFIASLV